MLFAEFCLSSPEGRRGWDESFWCCGQCRFAALFIVLENDQGFPLNVLRCDALNGSMLVWLPLSTPATKQQSRTSNWTKLSASGTRLPSLSIISIVMNDISLPSASLTSRSAVSRIVAPNLLYGFPGSIHSLLFAGYRFYYSGCERNTPPDMKLSGLLFLRVETFTVQE